MKKFGKFGIWLFGLTLLALLLRLVVSFELMRNSSAVFNPAPTSDPATYIQLAREIVRGEFSGPFYYQPFYYAGFLAPIVWLFGESLIPAIIVQAILSALTVLVVGLIGKVACNNKVGIIAAILTALANVLIFYVPYHKIATLQTFNVTLFTLFLVLAIKEVSAKKSLGYYCIAGLIMGISCATRGNIYLLLFGIVPLILSKGFLDKKRLFSLSAIVILFGAIFFAQTPFIVYNTIKCGKLSGASTASAAVLALGNTPEAPAGGRNYFAGNGPMEYPESYQIFMARDKERSVPLQIMDYFFDKPLEYIELSFRKVLLFWTWGEIPNNVSYYEGLKQSRCLFFNILGHSYIIILLGISGILFSLKNIFKERNYPLIMLLAVVIFYQLSIAFFYNLGRFRAPILADMAVFSSIFIVAVAENFKNRAMKKYLIGSLVGGAYLIFGYSIYQRYYESTIMEYVRPNGTEIATLNKGEKCIFDYGPISFGNWMGFSFKCGDTVTKEFKVKNPNQAGKLKFMLTNEERKGTALIKINGTPYTFELDKSADGYYIVPVTLQEGKVKLELISVYGSNSNKEVDLSMDGQRFYKRSWYNDEVIPFEWVMRFYYADKE